MARLRAVLLRRRSVFGRLRVCVVIWACKRLYECHFGLPCRTICSTSFWRRSPAPNFDTRRKHVKVGFRDRRSASCEGEKERRRREGERRREEGERGREGERQRGREGERQRGGKEGVDASIKLIGRADGQMQNTIGQQPT